VLSATFYVTAIILCLYKGYLQNMQLQTTSWKQISRRIHRCNFYSNRSTFEKVIQKIQRCPDFMEHDL